MDFGSINWFAVVVCVLISMVSGALWYSPEVFFNIWWRGIGKSEEDKPGSSNMGMTWILTIFAAFVEAVAMSLLVNALGAMMTGSITLGFGALIGFLIWLGFIVPTYLVNILFAGHGFKVWAIEVGNHLVNFVLFGMILGAWR